MNGHTPLTEIPTLLTAVSSRAIHHKGMTIPDTARVLKARYGALATRRRRRAMRILPRTASTLCALCRMEEDTAGHRLQNCAHEKMRGMVTNRHNWVVRYLAGVYMRGKRGG